MVDPFNGEGIRFAMITGAMAADAIAQALDGASCALEKYSERLQKEIGTEMNLARALAPRFYSPVASGRPRTNPHPQGIELCARLTCGDITYKKYFMARAFLSFLEPFAT